MAPVMKKIAAAALLAAAAAVGQALPVQLAPGSDITAETLAKAIARKMTSEGGVVQYAGNAVIQGATPLPFDRQFAFYGEASPSLVLNSNGVGVAFATQPVEAVFTGVKTLFNNASPPNSGSNAQSGTPGVGTLDPAFDSAGYLNYVYVAFDAVIPAGELTVDYAFCTARVNPGDGIADAMAISLEGTAGTSYAYTNLIPGPTPGSLQTTGYLALVDPPLANWVPGADVDLEAGITHCLVQAQATTTLTDAGTYTVRFTIAQNGNFGGLNTLADSQPTYAFLAAEVVTEEPHVYDPAGGYLTDEYTVSGPVDTWCVQANGNTNDFAPGFHFETFEAAGDMCCRRVGKLSGDGSVCEVRHCEGGVDTYTAFAVDPDNAPVCYAECLDSTAYIGNEPLVDLQPNIEGLWDDRIDPLQVYTGAPITTADFANPSGNNRRWVLAFPDRKATTGIALTVGGDIYVCRLRGVVDSNGECLIGCETYPTDFLSIGATEGSRCYRDCFYQL